MCPGLLGVCRGRWGVDSFPSRYFYVNRRGVYEARATWEGKSLLAPSFLLSQHLAELVLGLTKLKSGCSWADKRYHNKRRSCWKQMQMEKYNAVAAQVKAKTL